MSARIPILNAAQTDVLAWIAADCPPGRYEGHGHRVSAAALKNRGLIRIRGRGTTWRAELTEAGERYLKAGTGSDRPDSTPEESSPTVRAQARQLNHDGRARFEPGRSSAKLTKTAQLVADLVAAGGTLRLPLRYGRDGPTVRQRAYAAQDQGELPEGKVLTTRSIDGEIEVRLIDGTRGPRNTIERDLSPVTVPEKVDELHPIAKRFARERNRHEVSEVLLPRVLILVHAIATEARARHWKITTPPGVGHGNLRNQWSPARDGHLVITAAGVSFTIRIKEKGVKTRGKWEKEAKWARESTLWSLYRSRERPTGSYDGGATGLLLLHLEGGRGWRREHRTSNFNDRTGTRLEERLPHLFREIEVRVVETARAEDDARLAAERAAEAARVAAEERKTQWHVLIERAKALFIEEHRAAELRRQAGAWREAADLLAYCDALEAAHGHDEATRAWIAWARNYAASIDPLAESKAIPVTPDPTHQDLARFLPSGWNPYGPELGRRW